MNCSPIFRSRVANPRARLGSSRILAEVAIGTQLYITSIIMADYIKTCTVAFTKLLLLQHV